MKLFFQEKFWDKWWRRCGSPKSTTFLNNKHLFAFAQAFESDLVDLKGEKWIRSSFDHLFSSILLYFLNLAKRFAMSYLAFSVRKFGTHHVMIRSCNPIRRSGWIFSIIFLAMYWKYRSDAESSSCYHSVSFSSLWKDCLSSCRLTQADCCSCARHFLFLGGEEMGRLDEDVDDTGKEGSGAMMSGAVVALRETGMVGLGEDSQECVEQCIKTRYGRW